MKKVLILGCTGSIGSSSLDIIRNESEFCVCGLTANSNEEKLIQLGLEFRCPVLLFSKLDKKNIKSELSAFIEKTKPDIVVNGIAGSSGLIPSICVLEAGIDLALANKESVVMAGPIIFELARKNNCKIIPVDSEHSAIFSLLNQCGKDNVDRLIITASGGPFRTWSPEAIKKATLKDALKHPTWNMGTKITVDSATLGNKGLEVIEAKRLFGFDTEQIQVVVHPQSIIHSLVRTKDGIVYGQFSEPDMKHPIISALTYPEIRKDFMKPFDLTDFSNSDTEVRTLTFEKPRTDVFPLLDVAFKSAKIDGFAPIAFNAANEIAAGAFIKEGISFPRISEIVSETIARKNWASEVKNISDVFEADKEARDLAKSLLTK